MARVYEADNDTFSALVNARPTAQGIAFLARQFDEPTSMLTATGAQFMERAKQAFDSFDFRQVINKVEAITRTVSHLWDADIVRRLECIAGLQQAKPVMRRWLAANPLFRKEYEKGRISGWRGDYLDAEPGTQGLHCTDYKRVMNGMPQFDAEGHVHFTTYAEVYEDGLEELSLSAKDNILSSWDELEHHIRQGENDPTDPWNGML